MAMLYFYYASMNAGKSSNLPQATMNLRIDEVGRAIAAGAQTEIGGNESYLALCRKNFRERLNG
jgi:thymidine kinase